MSPTFDRRRGHLPAADRLPGQVRRPGHAGAYRRPSRMSGCSATTGGDRLGDDLEVGEARRRYLSQRYTSSLRDIRRTYQRAFKALLLAARASACRPQPLRRRRASPSSATCSTTPRSSRAARTTATGPGAFGTHRAWFDLNLLPVTDPYQPPQPADDQRAQPSRPAHRPRCSTGGSGCTTTPGCAARPAPRRERPAWLLFYEAAEHQPDDPAELLRHLGIDIRHAPLVLTLLRGPGRLPDRRRDLESSAGRSGSGGAERWLDAVERLLRPALDQRRRPDRWAADDPAATEPDSRQREPHQRSCRTAASRTASRAATRTSSGSTTACACARADALLAYLCAMDRVPLPFAPARFATASARPERPAAAGRRGRAVRAGEPDRGRGQRRPGLRAAGPARARAERSPVTPAFAELWDGGSRPSAYWQAVTERERLPGELDRVGRAGGRRAGSRRSGSWRTSCAR